MKPVAILIAIFAGLLTLGAHAANDVVKFDQQNQLVGEIKYMERGKLFFKTAATDTIPVEWAHIDSIDSNQRFRVELTDGTRYLGFLSAAEERRAVRFDGQVWDLSLIHI